jgi:LmbE family N-acetylglucosaminyl deacetylase
VGDVSRLVVVSPHPDDEVLAAGGAMRWHAHHRREVVIVAVTDGEASHAASRRTTPAQLAARRARERTEALCRLGVQEVTLVRLRQPDQGCAARVDAIAAAVSALLRPRDVVVASSAADRHPDHVAVATAVRRGAGAVVDVVYEAPTWALVHGTAPPPSCTHELDDTAWAAKRHAVSAYRSQLVALGPDPVDGPVIKPEELAAMLRRREQYRAVPVR